MNITYALATLTESQVTDALAAHGTASSPIQAIKVGDVVLCGLGTLKTTYREVTDTKVEYLDCGVLYRITYADGQTDFDIPNGFWRQVLKMDTTRATAANRIANAYATAWDRRR